MNEVKIINGIEKEIPSKNKFGCGRLYPIPRESSNRFPILRIERVSYDENGMPTIYGDDEPNRFSQMKAEDFNLRNLAAAGVDLKEVSVNGSSPLNDTYRTEQMFNREMSNPLNFEKNEN